MQKHLFLAFVTAAICTLFLQTGFSQSIRIGLQGGLLMANIDHEPEQADGPEYKSITRPQISIPIEFGFGEIFAIQPEIMYGVQGAGLSQHGSSTIFGITTAVTGTATIQGSVLEIPLLAKLKFGPENFKIHFLAGPSIGFGLNGKWKSVVVSRTTGADGVLLNESTVEEEYNAVFLSDDFEAGEIDRTREFPVAKTNYNLHAGAGFDFNAGRVTCFVEGRYILGLSDLTPDEINTPDNERETNKGRRIGITAGVLVPLK